MLVVEVFIDRALSLRESAERSGTFLQIETALHRCLNARRVACNINIQDKWAASMTVLYLIYATKFIQIHLRHRHHKAIQQQTVTYFR